MTDTDRPTTQRDEVIADIFTTALEGGIGYWSVCTEYHWTNGDTPDVLGFRATIVETGDEDAEDGDGSPEHVIDRFVIRRGMQRLYRHLIDLGDEANRYQMQACRDFTFGRWDELDYDSDTADMAVQLGLLGEIRYA